MQSRLLCSSKLYILQNGKQREKERERERDRMLNKDDFMRIWYILYFEEAIDQK